MKKALRVCIDIDGTICHTKKDDELYSDVQPLPGAIESLIELKRTGAYIILYTARHMKTCESNVGRVVAKQGKTLFDWLEKNRLPYDEIWFGKPIADVYIDDRALKFDGNWNDILHKVKSI